MATKKKARSEREITDPIARELAIRWLCIRRGKDRAAAAEELDWLAKRGGDVEGKPS